MKYIFISAFIVFVSNKIHSIEFRIFSDLQYGNELTCNTQVILQCIVEINTDPVSWKVGNPVMSTTPLAAQCSGLKCNINPVVPSVYNFSYDENYGESNMTINIVTLAEDGKQYECDDGSSSLIFDAVVQVLPLEETTQITSKNVSGSTQITVSTGCVTPTIADLVRFRWLKVQDRNKQEYKEATPPSIRDTMPCQIHSDCITIGSLSLSDNFTIEEHPNAPEVYFQVQILLGERELFTVITSSTFQPKISDGCINSCDCCDCDIKDMFIVTAVAWVSAIILTIVGSCILNYSLKKGDLCKFIFQLATIPLVFLLGAVLLYKGEKKWGLVLVFLLPSFVLDAAFIGIDRYYVCLCENVCEIELVDHLWASFIYLAVSAVLSVPKYIILEHCCERESIVSESNSGLSQTDVRDKHEPLRARPLPRISSVSSRLGNEREQEHSLKHVQLMQRSPLPPISPKGHAKTGT